MKHSASDSAFHTNLLQALQKNKVMQGKLTEYERSHYIKLLKDMQTYSLKEKYNRELLYTWKKESYVRQLKKNLQEYQQQQHGVRDAYYQYQMQKLGDIIGGQQTLVIPSSEEERRVDVNAKYHRFLQENPLQISPAMRAMKLAKVPVEQKKDDENDKEEEFNTRGVEETWKHIHAQSAVGPRRKQKTTLPNIHRSATIHEIRRNRSSAKSLIPPKTAVPTREILQSSSDDKFQRSHKKSSSNAGGLVESIEPLLINSEILDKHTRADLVTMRSVRRPRKNPAELNLLFETRKRIYQINKRALDYQLHQRKCQLQQNLQFDRIKPIDPINHVKDLPENVPKENIDDNKQQIDPVVT